MSAGRRARAMDIVEQAMCSQGLGSSVGTRGDRFTVEEAKYIARALPVIADAVAAFAAAEADAAEVQHAKDMYHAGWDVGDVIRTLNARVAAAELERDEARREAATWKMHAYDCGYQP